MIMKKGQRKQEPEPAVCTGTTKRRSNGMMWMEGRGRRVCGTRIITLASIATPSIVVMNSRLLPKIHSDAIVLFGQITRLAIGRQ
jgi:hypothetical protein